MEAVVEPPTLAKWEVAEPVPNGQKKKTCWGGSATPYLAKGLVKPPLP